MQHLDPAVFKLMRAHPERIPAPVIDHLAEVYQRAIGGETAKPVEEDEEDEIEGDGELSLRDRMIIAKRQARRARAAYDAANRRLAELQREADRQGILNVGAKAAPPSAGARPPQDWITAQLPHLPPAAGPNDRRILLQVAWSRQIDVRWYTERCAQRSVVEMRGEAAKRIVDELGHSLNRVATLFGQDHTTVINAVRRYEERSR
jgi:hypothetical protein